MPTGVLLPSNLAVLSKIAAAQDSKFAISGVRLRVQDDGSYVVEATDTRVLAQVTGRPADRFEDFPSLPALAAAPNGESEAVVPAKAWATAFAKRHSRSKPILNYTAVVIGKEVTTFATADSESGVAEGIKNLGGRFPPCADVIPSRFKKPVFTIRVDPEQLARLLTVAAAFTTEDNRGVTLEFFDAEHPFVLRCEHNIRHQSFVGLAMPLPLPKK